MTGVIPVLVGTIFLITAQTSYPDGRDAPPHLVVTYESKHDMAECERDRHGMARAGIAISERPDGTTDKPALWAFCSDLNEIGQ